MICCGVHTFGVLYSGISLAMMFYPQNDSPLLLDDSWKLLPVLRITGYSSYLHLLLGSPVVSFFSTQRLGL